jgi:hypothetical protein
MIRDTHAAVLALEECQRDLQGLRRRVLTKYLPAATLLAEAGYPGASRVAVDLRAGLELPSADGSLSLTQDSLQRMASAAGDGFAYAWLREVAR